MTLLEEYEISLKSNWLLDEELTGFLSLIIEPPKVRFISDCSVFSCVSFSILVLLDLFFCKILERITFNLKFFKKV